MRKIFFIVFIAVCCHTNSWAQRTTTESENPKSSDCRPQRAFGFDIGIGSMSTSIHNRHKINKDGKDETAFTYACGFRYLYHFSPYLGVDFFKFNHKLSLNFNNEYYAYSPQMMMGVRGNSPSFAGCMSAYAAIRLGYGVTVELLDTRYYADANYFGYGICGELEIGFNINRFFFVGYSYNYQGGQRRVDYDDEEHYDGYNRYYDNLAMHYHAIRFGFNLGK